MHWMTATYVKCKIHPKIGIINPSRSYAFLSTTRPDVVSMAHYRKANTGESLLIREQ